ncbi:MAG: c-type cytochrome [Pirellulaceae bacterium]
MATLLLCFGSVLIADEPAKLRPQDRLIVETILRLKDFDIQSSEKAKGALLRFLAAKAGTEQYFELIERFSLKEMSDELVEYAIAHANETGGVRAAELLFKFDDEALLQNQVNAEDVDRAVAAITLIGHAAGKDAVAKLGSLIDASDRATAVRSAVVKALGRSREGQQFLLQRVADGKLADDLKFAAANVLLSSDVKMIATEASKYLELPATADSKPLPSLPELVRRKGNVEAGSLVFRKQGTCINCHKVNGEGKEVGPDLSEIGKKLSREAMYVSILDPSLAVSHNYETYSLLSIDGNAVTGLLVSQTDDSVTVRTAEGIDKTFSQDDVDLLQKQPKSLMPQDLQRLMTGDQLVDLVEYLLTLKK